MNGFCERKFKSMLLSGIFTKAVMYVTLLCDSIIAGYYVGESGVAAINAITPVTGVVTFFGDLEIAGLSSLTLNGLLKSHSEKAYLVTTGYNRNMIRFRPDGSEAEDN